MVRGDASKQKEATMANYKEYIEKLVKKIHLQQMTPDVKARYDMFAKNKDFIGNMKDWETDLAADVTLDDASYMEAYNAFAPVFESMSQHESELGGATKAILHGSFGDGKAFNHREAIPGVDAQLQDFADNVLTDENENRLTRAITSNAYVLRGWDGGFDFHAFREGIRSKKYQTDIKFRQLVINVLGFVRDYADEIFQEGTRAASYTFDRRLPENINDWFVARYNPGFQFVLPTLVKQLTTNAKFREDFKKYDYDGTISTKVEKGLEKTAYDDPKSDNFIAPVYEDKKNLLQRVDDKISNFWSNTMLPVLNPLRNAWKGQTPFSYLIMKALDGVKTKDGKKIRPTSGIQGILDNKEAILAKITEQSPNAKKHFEWFTKQMETYSKKKPKAFKGALKNADQMQEIVAQMWNDAIKSGKDEDIDACKTSMEILNRMRYGLFTSRTAEAVKDAEFNVFGSTNMAKKHELVGVLGKTLDKTMKYSAVAAIRGGALVRNLIMRSRSNINNPKAIEAAREQWRREHSTSDIDNMITGYGDEITRIQSGMRSLVVDKHTKKRAYDAANANLEAFERGHAGDLLNIERKTAALNAKKTAFNTYVNELDAKYAAPDRFAPGTDKFETFLKTKGGADYTDYITKKTEIETAEREIAALQGTYDTEHARWKDAADRAQETYDAAYNAHKHAIDDRNSLEAQKSSLEAERTAMVDGYHDKFEELRKYWNFLQKLSNTHQLTLSADKMRKDYISGFREGTSKAQQALSIYLASHAHEAA